LQLLFRKLVEGSPPQGELWIRPVKTDNDQSCGVASLVLRNGLTALTQGSGPCAQVVVDVEGIHPTLDDMLAAALAEMLLAGRQPSAGFQAFARYAELVRQGLRPSELPVEKTLEGLFLAIRNEAGKDLSDAAAGRRFQAGWQRLLDRILQAAESGQEPFNTPLFDTGSEFAQERAYLARDQEVYRQDVLRGERWRVRLPDGPPQASALILRQPHSLLFKHWSRQDRDAPAGSTYLLLGVDWGAGNWVFSTDPAMRLSLKSLADSLQTAEQAVDAAAAARNPWYDGARHNHTLIGSPKGGTKLPEKRLLKVAATWAKGRPADQRTLSFRRSHLLVMAASILLALTVALVVMGKLPLWTPSDGGRVGPGPTAQLPQHSLSLVKVNGVNRGLTPERDTPRGTGVFAHEEMIQLDAKGVSLEMVVKNHFHQEQPIKLLVTGTCLGSEESLEWRLFLNGQGIGKGSVDVKDGEFASPELRTSFRGEENTIRLFLARRGGDAASATVKIIARPDWNKVNLFLLPVGVSKYADDKVTQLQFAHQDAEELARSIAAQGLFNKVTICPKVLVNEEATKSKILAGLAKLLNEVHEHDLAVVVLCGHGKQHPNSEHYYFIPHDYNASEELAATALSWHALSEYLASMPCPVVVILDTCHSGAAGMGISRGDAQEELTKAIDQAMGEFAKAKRGMMILAACLAHQQAWEKTDTGGHGVFSMALLECITGKRIAKKGPRSPLLPAEKGGTHIVTLSELKQYAEERVAELLGSKQAVVLRVESNLAPQQIPIAIGAKK
jgi:hypothetical protein